MTMVMLDYTCVHKFHDHTYAVLYAHSKRLYSHWLRLVAIGYQYGMLP